MWEVRTSWEQELGGRWAASAAPFGLPSQGPYIVGESRQVVDKAETLFRESLVKQLEQARS